MPLRVEYRPLSDLTGYERFLAGMPRNYPKITRANPKKAPKNDRGFRYSLKGDQTQQSCPPKHLNDPE